MTPTIDDYWVKVEQTRNAQPEWRYGQTAFNVLYEMRPALAASVRTVTGLDPFYDDTRILAFIEWVEANW